MWALTLVVPSFGRPCQDIDVAEELWIRSAAHAILEGESVAQDRYVDLPPWVGEVALLDGYARASQMAPDELVAPSEEDRTEVAAGKVRVMAASISDFEGRLSRALRSPFAALRSAALDRTAMWTLQLPWADEAVHGFLAAELKGGGLAADVADQLCTMALRTPGGRRFDVLLGSPVVARRLGDDGRAGWDPVLGLMEEIIGTPLVAEEVAQIVEWAKSASASGKAAAACVLVVGEVRDGLDVPSAGTLELVQMIAGRRGRKELDPDELDAVIEAVVDAIVIGGRHNGRGSVRRIGEALAIEALAVKAQPAGGDDPTMGEERAARAAARLLPFGRQLNVGLSYSAPMAFEMWSTLDRMEHWPSGEPCLAALRPWLQHVSVDVRDATVRAIGQRFAYGERTDFLPLLLESLGDSDATLRSLSFAWLAQVQGDDTAPLQAQLRAAWDKEGHGTESPVLTERQARWLAQWPRDQSADVFREPLLGLLALVGTSVPTPGQGSVELLGGFAGDEEIYARVALLMERSLLALGAARDSDGRLAYDSAAARAARILHQVDAIQAEAVIHKAIARSMAILHGPDMPKDARPQLPKVGAALLGQTPGGRLLLANLLGPEAPRRVRYEAALQILEKSAPEEAAAEASAASAWVLVTNFGGVDGILRLRALQALGRRPAVAGDGAQEVDRFLLALTSMPGDPAERSAAIDALGYRGNLDALRQVFDAGVEVEGADAGAIDAAAYAGRVLRHAAQAADHDVEAAALLGLSYLERVRESGREAGMLSTVRGALLESLCSLVASAASDWESGSLNAGLEASILAEVLRVPVESARASAPAGFGRARRIEAQFLWASELAGLKALAGQAGLFRRAVGNVTRWGELDGRLLLALAQMAQVAKEPALAADLSSGAVIALRGEGEAQDHERRLGEAQWVLATMSLAANDQQTAVWALGGLLGAYRSGRLGRAVLRAMLPAIERPVPQAHGRFWGASGGSAAPDRVAHRVGIWSLL